MTPWSFQWTCNFWRLSSPSSILAAHLSLACQILTRSSEHVKGYVTASVESQHYWRMRYINTKILWGWDHLLLSQFSMGPAKFCARQLQKTQKLCVKSGYWTCLHAATILGVAYPQLQKHQTMLATEGHPATESMSHFICVGLLVQTCPKFNITTTSNQTEVVRRNHNSNCFCRDVITHTVGFPPYWKS